MPSTRRADSREPGWRTLALYSVPALGAAGPGFFVQFYFMNFATDVLLLAPATVAILLAGGRVWDAVTDPIAGYGSDRTRSRWGRRRPWLAAAAPASALAFIALWSPPQGLASAASLTVWLAVALFLFTSATTAWKIPHEAWALDFSDISHIRTRFFGARNVVVLFGAAASFVGMQFVGTASDPRTAASSLALVVALAMLLTLLAPVFTLKERAQPSAPVADHPWRAARDVMANRSARRLTAIWFFSQMGTTAQGIVAPYVAVYVAKRPDLMGAFPAFFIGPLIASIPLWIFLARRFGRKRVWLTSMLGASVSYASLFFLPFDDPLPLALLLGAAGFWTGCTGPIAPTFFADVADADALRTGTRREGTYFAVKEFVEKSSGATVALVVGFALQLAGFVPNVPQSPIVETAIRGCVGLLPSATLLIAVALLWRADLAD